VGLGFSFINFLQTCDNDSRRRIGRQTIGDQQFVSFVQFFLHKCGEVTLGRLHIRGDEPIEPIVVIGNQEDRMYPPLAVVPIPENVKDFRSILIRYIYVFTIKFCIKLNYLAITANLSSLFCKNFKKIPC
jgi:hypothetical protein